MNDSSSTLFERPIMGILYILNYVDRSALAATKVYGIMDDLNMTEPQFATAIAILFGKIVYQTRFLR
jgi:hypothetical protein